MENNKDNKKAMTKINNQNITRVYQLSDISRMADYITEAKMFGVKNKAEAFILLMVAENEGINPIQASMDYDIINGKPTIKTVAALRRFLEAGGQVEYKVYTDKECTVRVFHKQYGSLEVTWTIEKASKIIDYYDKQTGKPHYLTEKMNWKNYPRDMLKHRAVGEALRTIYPQGMKNLYTSEEAADFSKDGNIVDISAEQIVTNDLDNSNYNQDKDVFENGYNRSPYKKYEDQTWSEMEKSLLLWHINESQMKNTYPEYYKEAVAELRRRNSNNDKNKEVSKSDKKVEDEEVEKILKGREYSELDLKDLKKLALIVTDKIILKVIYDLIEKKLSELDIEELVKAREYYTNKKPNEKLLNIVTEVLNKKLSVCPTGLCKGEEWRNLSTDKLKTYRKDYADGKLIGYAEEYTAYIDIILLERETTNITENEQKETAKESKLDKTVIDVEANEDEDPFSTASDENWDNLIAEQEERENKPPHQISNSFEDEDIPFN